MNASRSFPVRPRNIPTLAALLLALAATGPLAAGESAPARFDYVASPGGIEDPEATFAFLVTETDRKAFVPYSKAFAKEAGFLAVKIPGHEDKTLRHRYLALKPVPVSGGCRYTLIAKGLCLYGVTAIGFAPSFKIDGTYRSMRFIQGEHFSDRHGFSKHEKDFVTPPGATEMIMTVFVGSKGAMGGPVYTVFEELAVERGAPLPGKKELLGKNLLYFEDFSQFPVGPLSIPKNKVFDSRSNKVVERSLLGLGNKTNALAAEIVEMDGRRVLKLTRKAGGYDYPRFDTRPVKLEGCWVRCSVRIKGEGDVTPGLWWNRRFLSWEYSHSRMTELTDEWVELESIRPCINPLTEAAAMDLLSRNPSVYYIDRVRIEVIEPDGVADGE